MNNPHTGRQPSSDNTSETALSQGAQHTSSDDWNKIGTKSIYTGGDETNETESQWYIIKPYSLKETEGSLAEYTEPLTT